MVTSTYSWSTTNMARSPHLPWRQRRVMESSCDRLASSEGRLYRLFRGCGFCQVLLSTSLPAGWEETAVYVRRVVSPCHVSSDPCLNSAADAQLPTVHCTVKGIRFRHREHPWVTLSGELPEIQKGRDSARRESLGHSGFKVTYGTILSVRRSGQVWRELAPSSHSGTGAARRAC